MPFGSKEFCGKVIALSLHVFALAVSGCKCKAQTALVTNTTPTSAHILTVEDSKFGLTSLVPETVQLGLVVYGKVRLSTDLDLSPAQGPPSKEPLTVNGVGGSLWTQAQFVEASPKCSAKLVMLQPSFSSL